MTLVGKISRFLDNLFNILADWFLICAGLLLMVKSFLTIDVVEAQVVVGGIGLLLCGLGIWFRHRRLKRRRKNSN